MGVRALCAMIMALFMAARTPAEKPPSAVLWLGCKTRPGMDYNEIVAKIIQEKAAQGAYSGNQPDEAENLEERVLFIIVKNIIEAIQNDAKIDIQIDPASSMIQTNGANAGGPVVGVGSHLNIMTGEGTIR